jgi:hypothetical protein
MSIVKSITNALTTKKGQKKPEAPVEQPPRRMVEMPIEFRNPLVPMRFDLPEALANRLNFLQNEQITAIKNIEQSAHAQMTQIQQAANHSINQVQNEIRLRFAERLFDFLEENQLPLNAPMSVDGNALIIMLNPETPKSDVEDKPVPSEK